MKNIAFLMVIICLASCGRDHFNNVLEIDLPENEPILAVTSSIKPNQDFMEVLVSQTYGVLENPAFATMPDADISLYKNGVQIGEFEYSGVEEKHYAYEPNLVDDIPGTIYRLEVSVPEFETVMAAQTMPQKTTILDAEYDPRGTINFDGDDNDELIVEVADIRGEENYYGLKITYEIKYLANGDTIALGAGDEIYLDFIDPILEYGADRYILFKDDTFLDQDYQIRVQFYPLEYWFGGNFDIVGKKLLIDVSTLTYDRYLYLKTLDAFRENRNNPFSEPVTVHHNFENGTGAFTLENVVRYELDIE